MTKRRKHSPQRTCIVCRKTAGKRTLIRLVRSAEQGVVVDPTGKLAGRGAYLCDNPTCWDDAARTGVLEKALRISLTQAEREMLNEHGARLMSRTESEE